MPHFNSRRLLALVALALFTQGSQAQTYSWDPALSGGTNLGGTGTWDQAVTANWYNSLSGLDEVWPGAQVAIFGGTNPGTVTISGTVTATGLTFNTSGYIITGGTDLELTGGGSATVTVAPGTATINSIITSTTTPTGLTLAGGGTLTLGGVNTFTGAVSVNAGVLSVVADSGLGNLANAVTLDGGALQATGTFTSARAFALGAAGGTFDVTGANNLTLSVALAANANALTKIGTGTVTLGAASTRSGLTSINAGRIAVTNISALGTGAVNVVGSTSIFEVNTAAATSVQTVNLSDGATFQWTQNAQLTLVGATPINLTAGGSESGTIFVGGTGATGKVLTVANSIATASGTTLFKTGGGVLQLVTGGNANFLGNLTITAGTVEFQGVDSLGTVAKTVTVSGTGDFATSGVNNRNNVVLSGGILSANNVAANYTGSITANATSTIALRQFNSTGTANSFTISGPISGAATLNVTAPAAATLTLTGNNSGYTGAMSAGTNATVLVNNRQAISGGNYTLAGGTLSVRGAANIVDAATAGVNGLNGQYFNFGSAEGGAIGIITGVNGAPSVKFAQDQLYLSPRVFNRTDAIVNIPNSGSGTHTIVPVPGYDYFTNNAAGSNSGGMWKGLVNITTAGTYTFTSASDDNSAIWIDGVLVVNSDTTGGKGVSDITGTITLAPGAHSFVAKWAQGGGGSAMMVSYSGADTSNTKVFLGTTPGTVTTGSLAATPLGAITLTANSTIDNSLDTTYTTATLGSFTLTATSITVNEHRILGTTTLTGNPTLAPTTGVLTFAGPITGTGNIIVNGPFLTNFNGTNNYVGSTTVNGGQLSLNGTGGTTIPGNLTINAANANGAVANVKLLASDQIADSASITMTQGILDLGAFNDTVAGITMNGGRIIGTGTLTFTTLTLNNGTISAGLGGTAGLTKSATGTAVLAGNSSYTGISTVTAGGILIVRSANGLGAIGGGNGTTVQAGATLQFAGATTAEDVTVDGIGVADPFGVQGSLRHLGGTSSLSNLTTAAPATLRVDAGELLINGALDVTLGALEKIGNGALIFTTNQATIPAVTHTAGILGFSGAQSFGTATVPAGLAYQFNSNPGAGVTSVLVPSGTSLIAGYAADNALLAKFDPASTGTLLLTVGGANALDFTAVNVSLGATKPMIYTGAITPNAAGYNLGGGAGRLNVDSVLSGANPVAINGDVQLSGINTFTGGITVNAGGRLVYGNETNFGPLSNVITLNGGTLQSGNNSDNTGAALFQQAGNPLVGGRVIDVVAASVLDVPARQAQGNFFTFGTTNTLTGSGALTKTGLGMVFVTAPQSYSGILTLDANSNRIDLRSAGSLPNVAGIVLGNRSELDVDNNNGAGSRQFPSANVANRVNDAGSLTFKGGTLLFTARNATVTTETFGDVNLLESYSQIAANSNPGGASASVLNFGTFNRSTGATLRFGGNLGTLGAGTAGAPGTNNTQVRFNSGVTAGVETNGWANLTGTEIITYSATPGIGFHVATYTAQAVGAFTPVAANVYNLTGATGTLNAGDSEMAALRFGGGNIAQVLVFNTGAQKLAITSGAIIHDNNNQNRDVGSTAVRGVLTAGPLTGNAQARELFLHSRNGNLRIFSQVTDNDGFAVAVVKDEDGSVSLDATTNNYTGGTWVNRGTLNVTGASGLGAGPVVVDNSRLNINAVGSIAAAAATGGYTVKNQGEIFIGNNTNNYNSNWDRFTVESGSTIIGTNNGAVAANQSLNSLTRVSTLTGGGQIVLQPGAVVAQQIWLTGDNTAGVNTIKNLGTNADLMFGVYANFNNNAAFVTVGAGTPWAGISTGRNSNAIQSGTIFANGDFTLQGLTRDGGISTLTLGAIDVPGSISIVNNTNGPILANILGVVAIGDDNPIYMPSNLTFVLKSNSIFQPNSSEALGFGGSVASVIVQSGATVDPGNFVTLGAAANQNVNPNGTLNGFQNLPYPVPSPVNGTTVFEAGGRFLINDASGIGSAPLGAWTMKRGSILDLGNTNAFFGRGNYPYNLSGAVDTTGVIQAGQFVYENGVIVRIQADNIYKLSQFIPTGSQAPVVEIFGANRLLTSQNNPFIIPVVGTPTIAPENFTVSNGMVLTNDSNDRQINEGRGKLIFGANAIIAPTTQTYLNIQEGIEVGPGVTVTIGSNSFLDGQHKLGAVQLLGPNSNVISTTANIVITNGSQLAFGAVNVWPDNVNLNLPTAVTLFPAPGATTVQPGNGTSLLINTGNFAEVIGQLTGTGAVIANAGGAYLAVGGGSVGDFSSAVVFKNTNGQQANLRKIGSSVMSYTGSSDSTGLSLVGGGTLRYVDGGNSLFAENRVQKGGTLALDNSFGTALNNRLGGITKGVGPMGGTLELIGHGTTDVQEAVGTLFNSASNTGPFLGAPGVTTLKITAGAAVTTFVASAAERFNDQGVGQQRSGTWIINSPTVSNAPMTYTTNTIGGGVVPGTGAGQNGLVQILAPGFTTGSSIYGVQAGGIYGTAGTPSAASRADYLGDANGDGVPDGFMTQDGVRFTVGNVLGTAVITGLPNTTGLLPGMLVSPSAASFAAGIVARIATVDSLTQITLTNVTTVAITDLTIITGGMRNLSNAEYSPFIRYNQTNGLNVKLTGTTTVGGDSRPSTLTMTPASILNISGTLPFNTVSSRLLLSSGGIFVQAGGTATINGGISGTTRNFLQTPNGTSVFLHTIGDLNLNAAVYTDSNVVKTGNGTLNVGPNAFNFFRGSLQIDAGVVILGANNFLANVRTQNGFSSSNTLYLNGGTLDLNGNSIVVNSLINNNELPGMGGSVTSTTAATLTVLSGGRFSGTIDGSVSLYKPANNTLLLTSDNTYTGTTTIAAGTLTLRDSGRLSGTSAVNVNYATLQFDNGYLSNVANRIAATTPVTLRGATVNITGAAGQVASQTFDTLTLAEGRNDFTSNAGGSGANEITIGNLVRTATGSGAILNLNQNYGFLGAAGNTTAIRNFITNINGSPLALVNGILPAWIIVGNDHFATYSATTGIGALTNTADGYRGYDSGDATTATATQNVNDGAARTFTTTKTINAWRIAGGAVTMTLNANVGLTIASGGLLTNTNNAIIFAGAAATTGQSLTSGTGELTVFVNQSTTSINIPITGNIDLVKSGGATLSLAPGTLAGNGPNTYTGTTYVNNGTLNLAGAAGIVAVPGNLVITAATVTETVAIGQIAPTSNVTIGGGGRLNMVNLAGVSETLASLTFLDGASATALASGLDRAGAQATSTVTLTAATPITSTNSNPSTGLPFIGANTGILAFSNAGGATLDITSGLYGAGNSPAVGLRISARIGSVPTLPEGGLIKSGNGLLVLDSGFANFSAVTGGYDGTLGSLTDVFNISTGFVRVDTAGGLGVNSANTTVQSGAVLLGANTGVTITGSITLKSGSSLGATISAFTLGTATTTVNNQSVLNVPTGTVHIAAYDYFLPATNNGNITINGRLTGAGTIDIYGSLMTQGNGGGGVITLGNPILTGLGSNDFTGSINVGTNAILQNQIAIVAPAVRSTGNALGTATINLNGGRLRIRDDATSGATAVSNTVVTYTTNVNLNANSFLDSGRVNATDTNSNNTVTLGTLNVASGTFSLTVDSNTGTGAAVGAGNYITAFANLDGSGTLLKAGGSRLQFDAIAGTFTGGIGIAGPIGYTVVPATNPNLILPTSASFPNFVLNGLYVTEASKTLNVTDNFSVNDNPGDVNLGLANNHARLGLTNSTAITVGTFTNNGGVGSLGGTATITATAGFTGNGYYLTTTAAAGAVTGRDLNLAGSVIGGTFRVAGINTVTVTGSTHTPAAVQVQSGTLALAPTGSAVSSGPITVFGSPASVASGTTAPIAAVTGTLRFAAPAGSTFIHTGNITNSGLVLAASGTTTVNGTINGSSTLTYTPGLLEGIVMGTGSFVVDGTRPANTGNFGVQNQPRMLQNNSVTGQALTGHLDNDVWVYTGYVKDNDGVFSFAGNQDDNLAVWINGTMVLNAAGNVVGSTALKHTAANTGAVASNGNSGAPSQNFGAGITLPGFGSGWHLVEIRMRNGAGGAGPWSANAFGGNFGFGYKDGIGGLDSADYIKPIDDGTGNLFVTPVGTKGSITVASVDASPVGLVGQSFDAINTVTLDPTNGTALLRVTNAAATNNADFLSVVATATSVNATFDVAGGSTVNFGTVSPAVGGATIGTVASATTTMNFVRNGLGDSTVRINNAYAQNVNVVVDTGVKLIVNATGNIGTSDATKLITLNTGATLGGTGGVVNAVVTTAGSILSPGDGATTATFGTGDLTFAPNTIVNLKYTQPGLNVNPTGAGNDWVNVNSFTAAPTGGVLNLSVSGGFTVTAPDNVYHVFQYQTGTAPAVTDFDAWAVSINGSPLTLGTDYTFDVSGGFVNIIPTVVPEPVTILLLGAAGLGAVRWVRRRKGK